MPTGTASSAPFSGSNGTLPHSVTNASCFRAIIGRFIEPVPNRLIVIKRGLMHKVQRVSPLAGSHVRASITGFFLDTTVAQRMMA